MTNHALDSTKYLLDTPARLRLVAAARVLGGLCTLFALSGCGADAGPETASANEAEKPTTETEAVSTVCVKKNKSHYDPTTGITFNVEFDCANQSGAGLYFDPSFSSPKVGIMDSTSSWFVCFEYGDWHQGGNNIWYYSQGDRTVAPYKDLHAWGFMPAFYLYEDNDPWPGMPECASF